MNDEQLNFLVKAHRASGAILRGQTPTVDEHLALEQLLTRLAPAVRKSQIRDLGRPASRWIPATPGSRRLGGQFFR